VARLLTVYVDQVGIVFACFYGLALARDRANHYLDHYGVAGEGWNWLVLAGILTLWIPIVLRTLGQFTWRRLAVAVLAVHAVCLGIYLLERY